MVRFKLYTITCYFLQWICLRIGKNKDLKTQIMTVQMKEVSHGVKLMHKIYQVHESTWNMCPKECLRLKIANPKDYLMENDKFHSYNHYNIMKMSK